MKLKRFLNEQRDIDNIVNMINKDCKKFIKEMVIPNKPLYRGLNNIPTNSSKMGKDFWKVKVRKDRASTDMPDELHKYLDSQFKKKFGWYARSEGLFCTRSKTIAYNYGDLYSIYPIGNYKYLYSTKIDDLFAHFDSGNQVPYVLSILRDDVNEFIAHWSDDNWEDYLNKYGRDKKGQWIYKGKPINKKDFEKYDYASLDWKPEIEYDEYIDNIVKNAREKLYKHIDDILKTYKTTNLKDAPLRTEIMIKCDEYYLLNDEYTNDVMDMLYEIQKLSNGKK